jgi:hypothetical protein
MALMLCAVEFSAFHHKPMFIAPIRNLLFAPRLSRDRPLFFSFSNLEFFATPGDCRGVPEISTR